MLVLSKNASLRDLEELGFKPKYDESTGDLIEYFYIKENTHAGIIGLQIKKEKNSDKPKRLRFRWTFKRKENDIDMPDFDKNHKLQYQWTIDNSNYYYWDFDKLYDLIKLGIIEKE